MNETKVTQIARDQHLMDLKGSRPLVSPVYHSVKYLPKNYMHFCEILKDRSKGYIYSRVANPTVRELEQTLATMQGRDDALCVSSGVAALTAVLMSVCSAGDHVLMFRESYKPTRFLVGSILGRFNITSDIVSIDDRQLITSIIAAKRPKIVLIETPTNPMVRLIDLDWLTQLCRNHGCMTLLDNTFAGFHHHGCFEIDFYVHSLTKFACGHSDAMGGVVIANQDHINSIFPVALTLGATLDPNAAFLILRGLKTYSLRTAKASQNALAIFNWLKTRKDLRNLRYPGDESHSDFNVWKDQMAPDGGSVLAFDLTGSLRVFIDALKIFSLTPSMGCVESLVAPCYDLYADDLGPELALTVGISDKTIRLAIGIEDEAALIADLAQALDACSTV